MWLVLTTACVFAVGYQIYERISFFRSWPVNVNVEINFNKTLKFPAVTICNQNSFRATKAAEFGLYDLIEDVFSKSAVSPLEDVKRYNASNITMEDLFVKLGHDKHDLFISCRWKNTKCTPHDFVPVLTDHGLCYTFSPNSSEMALSSPGIDSGLRLMLNIEQYEYMNGPHDSAGVKVLLHDPRQTPLVASLGQAVSTGFSTFAGINLLMIDYQSPPYGNCGSKKLGHSEFYTAEECFLDCMAKTISQKCGCRDIYMGSSGHSGLDICNLEQYFSCIKDAKDEFFGMFEYHCKCPVSCEVTIYDPTFSEGSLSDHSVDSLLSSNQAMSLYMKLLKASETKAKMKKRNHDEFRILFEPLEEIYKRFNKSLHDLQSILNKQSVVLRETKDEYEFFKYFLYWSRDCQLYAFRMGVLNNKDILSNYLSGSAKEFVLIWLQRIHALGNVSKSENIRRENIYEPTVEDLLIRKLLLQNAQDDIDSLFYSFSEGVINQDVLFSDLNQSYINHFVPKSAMKKAFDDNMFISSLPMIETINYCKNELHSLYSNVNVVIDELIELTESVYHNPDNESVHQLSVNAIANYVNATFKADSCRYILNRKVFQYPIILLELNQELSIRRSEEFRIEFYSMYEMLSILQDVVQNNLNNMNSVFKRLIGITQEYSESKQHSLMEIYSELLSENVQAAITTLKDFSFEVDSRQQALQEYISVLTGNNLDPLLEIPNTDDEIFNIYNLLYDYELSLENDISAYEYRLWHARNDFDNMRTLLDNTDHDFNDAIDKLVQFLETFNKSVSIDSDFFKKNFLKLKVFYRQLSYEYIQQQRGYDIFGLICDIGGSMGLFIGASMLTVAEVIDLLLRQTPFFRKSTKLKRLSSGTKQTSTQNGYNNETAETVNVEE